MDWNELVCLLSCTAVFGIAMGIVRWWVERE